MGRSEPKRDCSDLSVRSPFASTDPQRPLPNRAPGHLGVVHGHPLRILKTSFRLFGAINGHPESDFDLGP